MRRNFPTKKAASFWLAASFCGKTGILAAQALRGDEPTGFSSHAFLQKKPQAFGLQLLFAERQGFLLRKRCAVTNPPGSHPTLSYKKSRKLLACSFFCGKTGIRTLGTRKSTTVFETVPFDRSGIFPCGCGCKITLFFSARKIICGFSLKICWARRFYLIECLRCRHIFRNFAIDIPLSGYSCRL